MAEHGIQSDGPAAGPPTGGGSGGEASDSPYLRLVNRVIDTGLSTTSTLSGMQNWLQRNSPTLRHMYASNPILRRLGTGVNSAAAVFAAAKAYRGRINDLLDVTGHYDYFASGNFKRDLRSLAGGDVGRLMDYGYDYFAGDRVFSDLERREALSTLSRVYEQGRDALYGYQPYQVYTEKALTVTGQPVRGQLPTRSRGLIRPRRSARYVSYSGGTPVHGAIPLVSAVLPSVNKESVRSAYGRLRRRVEDLDETYNKLGAVVKIFRP